MKIPLISGRFAKHRPTEAYDGKSKSETIMTSSVRNSVNTEYKAIL